MPGAASRTVGELCSELHLKIPAISQGRRQTVQQLGPVYRDSVAALSLFGVYQPGADEIASMDLRDKAYLKFCTGDSAAGREFSDFSYIDEIRSLQLGFGRADLDRIISTRFNDSEDVILEALLLGGSQYAS
jgi:hypothetical protein